LWVEHHSKSKTGSGAEPCIVGGLKAVANLSGHLLSAARNVSHLATLKIMLVHCTVKMTYSKFVDRSSTSFREKSKTLFLPHILLFLARFVTNLYKIMFKKYLL
jgi:uncharacterized membrane protein AbrB (regulator of aidB expression)